MMSNPVDHLDPMKSTRGDMEARNLNVYQLLPKRYGTSTGAKRHFSIACRASAAILIRQGDPEAAGILLGAASRAANLSESRQPQTS